ncbi:unnamed protein product [Hymenolepis diminuta]|uniref:Uncharacterized protein n=1 Tax=Hymenolepis diminuta TaxID=6216 RepID=A0A564YY35_HYMDI|nr:unnamed protein product [Hymenolepis diminuta]
MLSRGLIQEQCTLVTYGLLHFLFTSSLPQHAALSLSVTRFKLVVASLNTFLVYSIVLLSVLLHNCC